MVLGSALILPTKVLRLVMPSENPSASGLGLALPSVFLNFAGAATVGGVVVAVFAVGVVLVVCVLNAPTGAARACLSGPALPSLLNRQWPAAPKAGETVACEGCGRLLREDTFLC